MKPYIGFGLGAHSFDGRSRWHNTEDMRDYMKGHREQKDVQQLSDSDLMEEAMILGLRLCEGVSEGEFTRTYGISPSELYQAEIPGLISQGLVTRKNGAIALTPYGMDLANQVFTRLLK